MEPVGGEQLGQVPLEVVVRDDSDRTGTHTSAELLSGAAERTSG